MSNVCVTSGGDTAAVDAVLKMWPPPAGPTDSESEKVVVLTGSSQSLSSSMTWESNEPPRGRTTDQQNLQRAHAGQPTTPAVTSSTTPGDKMKNPLQSGPAP